MKMYRRRPNINVFVRNKARYNPETEGKDFVCVNITDFAGTTIGDIKEEVKRRCRNTLKIDDLFLDNRPLDDDRSVAHFNLEDGTILETTSNPFWVTCMYIKHIEVQREQKANPNDRHTQNWTNKSIIRKRTLLSVLLNSKNEFPSQPPHFPTLDDFVTHLELIEKKGATMNPNYTGRDLRLLHQDYQDNDEGRSDDPLGAFIHRHAVRLGFRQPDPVLYNNRVGGEDLAGGGRGRGRGRVRDNNNNTAPGPARAQRKQARQRVRRICEDCEAADAEVYCGECQNASGGLGLVLCRGCTNALHAGAARRRHVVADIDQAPKTNKPYTPHAFKAPFSILVALYSGFTSRPPILSMTEDEVKERAQPLTDTDLQDKQNGRYVGGFECMENTLMQKGFIQREDARNPTYALTHKGQDLAEQLFSFQQIVSRYLASQGVPKIDIPLRLNTTCGRRKVCLIIDEQERDRERLLRLADARNIDAQVRHLPSGDYIWILTPPLTNPRQKYSQKIPDQELVLPYIVERKSWEDLQDSVRTKRFDKQVNNMMESGLRNMFYLMEGSVGCMKYKMTEEQRAKLKGALERLMLQNGFYVNYTASWFKSALWLVWMTSLVTTAFSQGDLDDQCVPYLEYHRRTARHAVGTVVMTTDNRKGQSMVWSADRFTELIFREGTEKGQIIQNLKHDIPLQNPDTVKSVLVVQNLEIYNKRRQTTLNKCLEEVFGDLHHMEDGVENKLHSCLHNMLHYDIMSYWQLRLQVMASVYVVRTETDDETLRIQQEVEESGNPGRFPHQGRMADLHTYGIGDSGRGPGRGVRAAVRGVRRGVPTKGQAVFNKEMEGQKARGKGKGRGQSGKGKAQNIPAEQDHITDEDKMVDTDNAVFASDSQTENFMIQQAIARSIQDTDMYRHSDESDEENIPHCSTTSTLNHKKGQRSTIKGQSSNTEHPIQPMAAFSGRGQQLGYNDVEGDHNGTLNEKVGHGNHDIQGQRSTDSDPSEQSDALNIDGMDEEELLQLTIKKSLEEAELQKTNNGKDCNEQNLSSSVGNVNTAESSRKVPCQIDVERSLFLHHQLSKDDGIASPVKQQRLPSKGQVHDTTRSWSQRNYAVENGDEGERSRTNKDDIDNHHGVLMESDSQDEELQRILLLSKQEYEDSVRTSQTAGPSHLSEDPVILIDSQEQECDDHQELHYKQSTVAEAENQKNVSPVCSGSILSPILLIDSQEDTYFQDFQVDENDSNIENGSFGPDNLTGKMSHKDSIDVIPHGSEKCGNSDRFFSSENNSRRTTSCEEGPPPKTVGSYQRDRLGEEMNGSCAKSAGSYQRDHIDEEMSGSCAKSAESYQRDRLDEEMSGSSAKSVESYHDDDISDEVDGFTDVLRGNSENDQDSRGSTGSDAVCDNIVTDTEHRDGKVLSTSAIVESLMESLVASNDATLSVACENSGDKTLSMDDKSAMQNYRPSDKTVRSVKEIKNIESVSEGEAKCNIHLSKSQMQTNGKQTVDNKSLTLGKERRTPLDGNETLTEERQVLPVNSETMTKEVEMSRDNIETRTNEREMSLDESQTLADDIVTVNDLCQRDEMDDKEQSCDDSSEYKNVMCISENTMDSLQTETKDRTVIDVTGKDICEIPVEKSSPEKCGQRKLYYSPFTKITNTVDENFSEISDNILAQDSQEDDDGLQALKDKNEILEDDDIDVIPPSPEKNCETSLNFCKTSTKLHFSPGSLCNVVVKDSQLQGVGCSNRNSLEKESDSVFKVSERNSTGVRVSSLPKTPSSSYCVKYPSQTDSEKDEESSHQKLVPSKSVIVKCSKSKSSHCENNFVEESESILCNLETRKVSPVLRSTHSGQQEVDTNREIDEEDSQDLLCDIPLRTLSPSLLSVSVNPSNFHCSSTSTTPKITFPTEIVSPLLPISPTQTMISHRNRPSQSSPKSPSPPPKNPSPSHRSPVIKNLSSPVKRLLTPQKGCPESQRSFSPSSLSSISPPPRESLSPPPDSEDFDAPVLPPLSPHTSPVDKSSSPSLHRSVLSSNKPPQNVSFPLGNSKIDSPPQTVLPNLSNSSRISPKIPPQPEIFQNQSNSPRVTLAASFHSPRTPRAISDNHEERTSANLSPNMKVFHSPAKKQCPSSVIDTRKTHIYAARSDSASLDNFPADFQKDTHHMGAFSPTGKGSETILIKQEKMDACFKQSNQEFINSTTAGPSCGLKGHASEQIVNRTQKVQQIQNVENSQLNLHSNENMSQTHRKEDRSINEAGVDDAEVARKLQELFDKEYEMTMSQKKQAEKRQTRRSGPIESDQRAEHQEKSKEKKFSAKNTDVIDTSNDAVIAQQLQQDLLMGDHSARKPSLQVDTQRKGSGTSNFSNENTVDYHEELLGTSKDLEERDRLYAQQLQEIESGHVPKGQTTPRKLPFTSTIGADNSDLQDSLLLARRLQEEEEKKARQGETMLEEDEALARQLSETDKHPMPVLPRTVQKRHADSSPELYSPKHARRDVRHLSGGSPAKGVASSTVGGANSSGGGAISSSAVERVWHKKLFAMEKQAKRSTAEQLQAIRREQNERYKVNQGKGMSTFNNLTGPRSRAGNSDIPHTASSPRQHPHIRTASSWDDESQNISLDENGYITSSPPHRRPDLIPSSPNCTPSYSQVKSGSSGFGSMSSNRSSTSTSSHNHTDRLMGFQDHKSSQISSSTPMSSRSAWDDDITTQKLWNDSEDFKSSQISSSISSTQSSSSCNITCGNCGEKGHNRNSKTCSRYYSLEETQHRQAKQEKARQRTEEKVQRERQTREQLANHQMVLEDIAFRIQQEKDGLSDTLKKMEKKTKQREKRKK